MIRVKEGYQDMQFSKRLDLFGDEIFAALNERKVELEAQGRTIYNLSVGTPDFAPAEHIRKAMMDAAADPQNWKYSLRDLPELLDAVCGYYKRRFGVEITPDQVASCAGSQEGVGHIGMERDEVTHEPHEYYCKMPKDIDQRICLVVDPMLATGGSAEMAISYLRERGVKDIRMLCIVAAPEGLKSLTEKDPDVHIYTCAIDDHLNEAAYIVPGLGDAGDRIYGTL